MTDQPKLIPPYGNLALEPTAAESAAWEALSREDQLAILVVHVNNPEASTDCGLTMKEIMAEIRECVFAKENA